MDNNLETCFDGLDDYIASVSVSEFDLFYDNNVSSFSRSVTMSWLINFCSLNKLRGECYVICFFLQAEFIRGC